MLHSVFIQSSRSSLGSSISWAAVTGSTPQRCLCCHPPDLTAAFPSKRLWEASSCRQRSVRPPALADWPLHEHVHSCFCHSVTRSYSIYLLKSPGVHTIATACVFQSVQCSTKKLLSYLRGIAGNKSVYETNAPPLWLSGHSLGMLGMALLSFCISWQPNKSITNKLYLLHASANSIFSQHTHREFSRAPAHFLYLCANAYEQFCASQNTAVHGEYGTAWWERPLYQTSPPPVIMFYY